MGPSVTSGRMSLRIVDREHILDARRVAIAEPRITAARRMIRRISRERRAWVARGGVDTGHLGAMHLPAASS
jgi:hypothetical protein